MKVTITGATGFIGSHLTNLYLTKGHEVLGIDSMTDYYSRDLKLYRLEQIRRRFGDNKFEYYEVDVGSDFAERKIREFMPEIFVHLSAQAGVRQGLDGIISYSRNNIEAFLKVIKIVKEVRPRSFLYASSSSVYGQKAKSPFSESEEVLHPQSIYGITKLANEMFVSAALSDSETRSRGLRFFTVYGPMGRPDMAYSQAISSALFGSIFRKFGTGDIARDFTFISDVTKSVLDLEFELSNRSKGYMDVVNVGGGNPLSINEMLSNVERITGKAILIEQHSRSTDDTPLTFSDTTRLTSLIGPLDFVRVEEGLRETIDWFKEVGSDKVLRWIN